MPSDPPPWREFTYPLNVFMHILTHEEGRVSWLHYGLFETEGETLAAAQERSTALLLSRLPPPPARLLEVGIGLATTLQRLIDAGYDAEGITPDANQIAMVRARYGDTLLVHCAKFEEFMVSAQGTGGRAQGHDDPESVSNPLRPAPSVLRSEYDVILFQESSQYIDSEALFARASDLAPRVLVLDEFALRPLNEEGALRSREGFLAAATRNGYSLTEELDLSAKAAPTMAYFTDRIPRYRERLMADLDLTSEQLEDLITSGARYRQRYEDGTYGYRLMDFELNR